MNWIILVTAGLFEIGFTFSLGQAKITTGKTSIVWYLCFALCIIVSMGLLMKAIQTLPLGTAYAVWTGIGAVGTVLMGIFFFHDPINFWRIFFIFTLIVSIIGLKIVSI